jgi:hypothetical protein
VLVIPNIFIFNKSIARQLHFPKYDFTQYIMRDMNRYLVCHFFPCGQNSPTVRELSWEVRVFKGKLFLPSSVAIKFGQKCWSSTNIGKLNGYFKVANFSIKGNHVIDRATVNVDVRSLNVWESVGAFFSSIGGSFSRVSGFFSRTPQVNITDNKKPRENSHDDSCEYNKINSTNDVSNITAGHNIPQNRVLIPLLFLLATMGMGSISCSYFMQGFIMQEKERNAKYILAGICFIISVFVGCYGFYLIGFPIIR